MLAPGLEVCGGLQRRLRALGYAAHQLQAGMTIRELQEQLGHASIETTLRYCALAPPRVESPLDQTAFATLENDHSLPALSEVEGLDIRHCPPPHTHTPTPSGTPVSPRAAIPPIHVGDSEPPFSIEDPVRYFLGWLRRRFWLRPRRLRLSG